MTRPNGIARTPEPPYYAVIFTSKLAGEEGYADTADRMAELAARQPGFLGMESARDELGVTVSYWRDLAAIEAWKNHVDHAEARRRGREDWYAAYRVRIALVEKEYGG